MWFCSSSSFLIDVHLFISRFCNYWNVMFHLRMLCGQNVKGNRITYITLHWVIRCSQCLQFWRKYKHWIVKSQYVLLMPVPWPICKWSSVWWLTFDDPNLLSLPWLSLHGRHSMYTCSWKPKLLEKVQQASVKLLTLVQRMMLAKSVDAFVVLLKFKLWERSNWYVKLKWKWSFRLLSQQPTFRLLSHWPKHKMAVDVSALSKWNMLWLNRPTLGRCSVCLACCDDRLWGIIRWFNHV